MGKSRGPVVTPQKIHNAPLDFIIRSKLFSTRRNFNFQYHYPYAMPHNHIVDLANSNAPGDETGRVEWEADTRLWREEVLPVIERGTESRQGLIVDLENIEYLPRDRGAELKHGHAVFKPHAGYSPRGEAPVVDHMHFCGPDCCSGSVSNVAFGTGGG